MRKPRRIFRFIPLFGLLLVLALLPRPTGANEPDAQDLQTVWEHVRQSGDYSFIADLTQTTSTHGAVHIFGPSTQKSSVHLEGHTDLPAGSMELTLWKGGGSVLLPETGTQIKIADGRAMARQGGGSWQEVDDFSQLMAPGGDFLAFLSAANNVVRNAPETMSTALGELTITRFTFDIDGPQFAAYMRDLLNKQMTARGELPVGVKVDLPKVYAGMTGRGELWVGEDGLPVSQEFDLEFPGGAYGKGDASSSAHIAVTFSQFATPPATIFIPLDNPAATKLNQAITQSTKALAGVNSFNTVLAVLAAIVVIFVMLMIVRRSGSRLVYAAIAVSVSFSMLASPFLNSMHVAAYGQKQFEQQAAQDAQQANAETADAWQSALDNPGFDPHSNPLDVAKTRQETERAVQAGDSANNAGSMTTVTSSSTYFDSSCETDPGNDDDGDLLTNLEECLIGTLPGAADTDLDGVDDGLEVKGFVLDNGSNVTWYTNPLHQDTNRDGLGDGAEWYSDKNGDGLPDDTDGDGIPDLWDDDNDGDGVPDDLDLSPYGTTKDTNVFAGDNPFQLIVNDLGEGLITKVEFQLSPTNPKHLWYTNNVLDWATGDQQGQMQDADGATFYDVQNTVDNPIDPWPSDLGDVRLVPMLEIEMTGTPNNLPDQDTLDMFGISVVTATADTKIAYVPVQLVTDNTGARNVAFHGAMYYRANSSWGNAQSVRLVWLVQALVDVCDTYKNGICDTYSAYNDLQVIHDYDDEWYLTGMEVSEERGTNMAIIYEDPAVEKSDGPLYMNTLYQMAYGLDRTFLAGADCEVLDANDNCVSGNGQLDLTVADIYTRFNHTTNSGVPSVERWGLPNILGVETNSYEAVETAMMASVITETKAILDNHFTGVTSVTDPITPTVMFAWEHNYRVVSLSSDNLSWSDKILTVDVATSGDNIVPLEQENGMKWAPFAYSSDDDWYAADINAYWNNLDNLLPGYMSGSDDVPTDVAMSKLLYFGMNSGETNIVKINDRVVIKDYETADVPLQLKFSSIVGTGVRKVVSFYFGGNSAVERIVRGAVEELDEDINVLERFSLKFADTVANFFASLRSFNTFGLSLMILTTFTLLIVAGYYLYRKYVAHNNAGTGWRIAGSVAIGTIAFALIVVKQIYSMVNQVRTLVEIGDAADTAEAVEMVFAFEGAPSIEYNVLGLIISFTLAVAIFLTLVISGQVKVGTIAFSTELAQTIAAIIVALIIFLINLTGIGALLLAIATVIDLILLALGINFSILGKLTDFIADLLYGFTMSGKLDVETGGMATALANPDAGIQAGNKMIYSMPITTVITQSSQLDLSLDQFRSNSFKYDMDSLDAYQAGLSTTHGDRANDWVLVGVGGGTTRSIGTMTDTVSFETTLSAGVNEFDRFLSRRGLRSVGRVLLDYSWL